MKFVWMSCPRCRQLQFPPQLYPVVSRQVQMVLIEIPQMIRDPMLSASILHPIREVYVLMNQSRVPSYEYEYREDSQSVVAEYLSSSKEVALRTLLLSTLASCHRDQNRYHDPSHS